MLPLFPALSIVEVNRGANALTITLENRGSATLRGRDYGQPAYRALFKLFDGDREVQDEWVVLPKDVRAGDTVTITLPLRADATSLHLHHALESIPIVDSRPAEIVNV